MKEEMKAQPTSLTFHLKGDYESRTVELNNRPLGVSKSLKVVNHSPDGFNWGYGGSGPSQLALAIMLELVPRQVAYQNYMRLKWEVIALLPQSDFNQEVTFTVK